MADGDQVFHRLAQDLVKESPRIRTLGQLFRDDDFAGMRLAIAEVDFHHTQKLGHGVQTRDPAVDTLLKAKRPGLGKTVVGDHVGHVSRIKAQRSIHFLGQIRSAVARCTDNIDEVKPELDILDHFQVAGQQRYQQFVGTRDVLLPFGVFDNPLCIGSRLFNHIFLIGTQFFTQLIAPLCFLEVPVIDNVGQKIDKYRGYR